MVTCQSGHLTSLLAFLGRLEVAVLVLGVACAKGRVAL